MLGQRLIWGRISKETRSVSEEEADIILAYAAGFLDEELIDEHEFIGHQECLHVLLPPSARGICAEKLLG